MHHPQQRHLRRCQRIGGLPHLIMAFEQQLPQAVQLPGRQPQRPIVNRRAFLGRNRLGPGLAHLRHGHPVDQLHL